MSILKYDGNVNWGLDKLYELEFDMKYDKDSKKTECDSIVTFDIECSNGYKGPAGKYSAYNYEKALLEPSYHESCAKASLMYVWQAAVEDKNHDIHVFMGRTWDEFKEFHEILTKCMVVYAQTKKPAINSLHCFELIAKAGVARGGVQIRAHMYIHNEGYEYQHLRNIYNDLFSAPAPRKGKKTRQRVFARKERKPMKVDIKIAGVQWIMHDTLCLTQKSLAKWCDDDKLPVRKLSEPKDFYIPVRTPETPLTDNEIQYSVNDVVCMVYGVDVYRTNFGSLKDIPMTQTGIVRRLCKSKIAMLDQKWAEHCKNVTLSYTKELYDALVMAFAGGWTHANAKWANKLLENVVCFDFRSSYPAVMTTRKFPIGKFEDCELDELDRMIASGRNINFWDYRYMVEFEAEEIGAKTNNTFWSTSKCTALSDETEEDEDGNKKYINLTVDNGKISYAKYASFCMTDLDYDMFLKTYECDEIRITKLRRSKADYLPVSMVKVILDYYKNKTSLKDVEGEESRYYESKQFINSIYGCCVMKIICDMILFEDGKWGVDPATDENFQAKLEASLNEAMFTTYQIGVWVTAWARYNLWSMILLVDDRVAYGDTDSLKGMFTEEDIQKFNEFNKKIQEYTEAAAKALGIDVEDYAPITPGGKVKELGYFDREEDCRWFKTLGAKRYLAAHEVKTRNGIDYAIESTIAGISKKAANARFADSVGIGVKKGKDGKEKEFEYFKVARADGTSAFDMFEDKCEWNSKESEKLTSYYLDNQEENQVWMDRDGNEYISNDKYGINLMPTTFSMTMTPDYKAFIDGCLSGSLMTNEDCDSHYYRDLAYQLA